MFSATWPKEVRTLANDFLKEPVFLNVGSLDIHANHNIQQIVEIMDEYHKERRLMQLLEQIMKQVWGFFVIKISTKIQCFTIFFINIFKVLKNLRVGTPIFTLKF